MLAESPIDIDITTYRKRRELAGSDRAGRTESLREPVALRTTSRSVEALDVAELPSRLNRPRVVVLADERDRLVGGHTIQNCKTCEGGARPAAPAATGDFHAFVLGSAPCLPQRVSRVHSVGG